MARQIINIGAAANDGTGDPLRPGGDKINSNFAELYALDYGFRNRIRNASFLINQRAKSGTVTLAAGEYGHDGVKGGASGATYTFSTSGLDTTLNISAGSIVLPIEGLLIEGGGDYILSHAGTAQARVYQGAPSGSFATVPAAGLSVPGLTAGATTFVEFSTGTVLRPQLERNIIGVTAFERRSITAEVALNTRYFIRVAGSSTVFAIVTAAGSVYASSIMPAGLISMRTVPTITHNLTDANCASGSAPTVSQWAVTQDGTTWSTKTGTVALTTFVDFNRVLLMLSGASFSPAPIFLRLGAAMRFDIGAEI